MAKHKHCELIHAWADGAEIQIKSGQLWLDIDCPHFYDTEEYRVKPRTVTKVGWVNISRYCGGLSVLSCGEIYESREAALARAKRIGTITAKVEWEEEEV